MLLAFHAVTALVLAVRSFSEASTFLKLAMSSLKQRVFEACKKKEACFSPAKMVLGRTYKTHQFNRNSSHVVLALCLLCFSAEVPAQPADFEAEAELDSRVMLSWLWPVQDHIISYELRYWEDNNPAVQVNTPCCYLVGMVEFSVFSSLIHKFHYENRPCAPQHGNNLLLMHQNV